MVKKNLTGSLKKKSLNPGGIDRRKSEDFAKALSPERYAEQKQFKNAK